MQGNGTLQRLQQLIIGAKIGTGEGSFGLQLQGAKQGEGTDVAVQVAANNLAAVVPALGFEGGVTGKANLNAWLTLRTPACPASTSCRSCWPTASSGSRPTASRPAAAWRCRPGSSAPPSTCPAAR